MNNRKPSNLARPFAGLCLLALLACAPSQGHAQTILNPSFEADSFTNWPGYISANTSITGWTSAPPDRVGLNPVAPEGPFSDNGTVPQGTNVALIQSDGDVPSTLATVITGLTRGWEYHVSFRANSRQLYGGAPAPSWSLNGGAFVPFVGSPPVGGANPYHFVTGSFTATNDTAELVIRNQTPYDSTVLVDDFSIVVGAMIPNPSFEADSFTNFPGYAVDNGGGITGWTLSDPARTGLNPAAGSPFADNGATPHGSNVAFVQVLGNGPTVLSTTIANLVPNQVYEVRFRANARTATFAPDAQWSLNGGPFTHLNIWAVGDTNDYHMNSGYFTATGSVATLEIRNLGDFFGADTTLLVDDFSIQAVPWLVTVTNDSGVGSLRRAIAFSPAGSTITFDAGLAGQKILLTSGELLLNRALTIDASALPGGIIVDGNGTSRIFQITPGATVALNALTVTNGFSSSGGAIQTEGALTLNDCRLIGNQATSSGGALAMLAGSLAMNRTTVAGNRAVHSAALFLQGGPVMLNGITASENSGHNGPVVVSGNHAVLAATNCTFSGNIVTNSGSAVLDIYSDNGNYSTAMLAHCTVASNFTLAAGQPGAIRVQTGTGSNSLALFHSIVAGNLVAGLPNDITGPAETNSAVNLIGTGGGLVNGVNGNQSGVNDPLLLPLGDYGGPTRTMPPRLGSPVVNAAFDSTRLADQRGLPTVAVPDIGATEMPIVNPSPAHGGVVYQPRPALFWTGPATVDYYEVFFGTTPGELPSIGTGFGTAIGLPAPLVHGSNYFWRVDAIAGGARFAGPEFTFTALPVSTTNDTGPGSLRQTMADAPAGTTIGFAPELSGQTVFLTNGPLVLDKNLSLDATTLPDGLALHGRGTTRVIEATAGTTNWLYALTVTGGAAAGNGGGLRASGEVGLYRCTISGNAASGGGGGLAADGTNARLIVVSCTIVSNSANSAGGVFSQDAALEIWQSTVARNSGVSASGGLELGGGTALIANSIIAQNTGGGDVDIGGSGAALTLTGGNLIGDNSGAYAALMPAGLPNTNGHFVGTFDAPLDPLLTPLGAYGGPTRTMLLRPDSRAVNAGGYIGLGEDQRGAPLLGAPDLGATEMIVDYPTPAHSGSTVSLSPQLSWLAWSPGATSFRVALGTNSGNLTSFAEQQSYWFDVPEALVPGQTYFWRVDVSLNGTFFTGPEFTFTCRAFVNTNDSGPGSLRDAIAAATPGTTVNVPTNLSGQIITLASELVLDKNLNIISSFDGGLTLRGHGSNRVLRVASGSTVLLDGLTFTNGFTTEHGGGALTEGVLTLRRCTLAGNVAAGGGGGAAALGGSRLILENSTVASNHAAFGGGLYSQDATLELSHATLAGNTGTAGAGGLVLSNGSAAFISSVLAHNPGAPDADITGAGASLSFSRTNFIGRNTGGYLASLAAGQPNAAGQHIGTEVAPLDAQLGPLGNYGGPTPTMPPLGSSALVDRTSNFFPTDQRRRSRPAGPRSDIGAVELEPNSVVSTNNDAITYGTLRYAINYLSSGSTINFATNLSGATILLTNGQLLLNKNLTIDASALPGGILLNGNRTNRIFEISSSRTVQLSALTITNGSAPAGSFPANSGGGILNRGTLTLNDCTLVNNQARLGTQPRGGGIANSGGILILNRSTLNGNLASHRGGGIYNSGRADLNQCTLAANLATNAAGAISSETSGSGYLSLNHSTIVSNVTVNGGRTADGSGTMTFSNSIVVWSGDPSLTGYTLLGVNLVGDTNAQLAALGSYGGRTQTMPPLPGSPAIDAATSGSGFATDQRGATRIVGAFPDIGAVEANWLAPAISAVSATVLNTDPVSGTRTVLLSALVTPNGLIGTLTSARFDYGMTLAYGGVLGPVLLPVNSTPSLLSVQLQLGGNQTYQWRITATNTLGTAVENRTFTLGTPPGSGVPGDLNGDGVVSQSELDAVYANYLPTSPWLQMTNLAGLGSSNVSFALNNSVSGAYSVEFTTNLVDWLLLGPATPRYQFTDTNAPAGPMRYYRLRFP
jgi:hypothetical protein